jgi:uncharacterized membrane protein YccC
MTACEYTENMSGRCSICVHAKQEDINASLASLGTRPTAREFAVSLSALARHKRHLHAKPSGTPEDILGRIERLVKEDSAALRELRTCLQLIGAQLHGTPQRREEDLELAIAQKVSEATLGFNPEEIARLKILVERAGLLVQ